MTTTRPQSALHRVYIVVLILSLLTACGGGGTSTPDELVPEAGPPEEDHVEEIEEGIPEDVFFWGFDDGPPPGWDFSPDWQYEGGHALSGGPDQVMFSAERWGSFNLFSRIRTGSDTAFGIFIRAGENARYQIIFEPGAFVFFWHIGTDMDEVVLPGYNLEPGWHEVHILAEDQLLSITVDGENMFEKGDLQHTSPGNIGFLNHSEDVLAIDFIEVHTLDHVVEEVAEPGGPIPEGVPEPVLREAPIAGLIDVGNPGEGFQVTLTGEAGAVTPGSLVSVANLATSRVYFTDADEDGSFQLDVFAFPGTSLQIKHADIEFYNEEERNEALAIGQPREIIHEWLNATAGTILRVPDSIEAQPDEIAFAVNGHLYPGQEPYWHVEGVIQPINSAPETMQLRLQGSVTLYAKGLVNKIDLNDFNTALHIALVRHFAESGHHSPVRKYLISDFLSPTGFPIYHGEFAWSPIPRLHPLQRWQQVSEDAISADFQLELSNEDRLPLGAGYFGLQFQFLPPEGFEPQRADGPTMRSGIVYANGGFYSPVFRIGSPEGPHLHWGLLTDTLHEATRGATAREDQDQIGLVSMISLQDEKFVLPKDDPRTGEPISYRLEPFLPLIAYGDRGIPNPPTIDFAFPSGELTVTVHRPDGGMDVLGPAPFVQSTHATPSYDFGKVKDYSNGGGAMQEAYQLATLNEVFDYAFDQYGHYEVEMIGTIDDIRGNTYTGGGTYDLYVAKPLKLYNGMLPTTPFVEGDRFSPSLQVYPRFPVEVDMTLTFLPASSVQRAITQRYSGRANEFGYFYPRDQEPFTFQDGGEYRVDLSAQYTDEDGRLWMGSATWGNVVENADTSIVAHGIRGLDSPDANGLWFFHNNLGLEGIFHTFFPYYSGDVFWGFNDPREDAQVQGADAIIPGVSLEDTSGSIYSILQRNWTRKAHAAIDMPDFAEAMADGQVIPFSTTTSGMGLEWFPEQIDQYGYGYMSSQRPGARVHESLGEGGLPIGYWRYDGTYGDQVGIEGDLPNDIKWQFTGVVFRDQNSRISDYGVYGSLWVLAPDDDPMGARVTPPFQGATGGPNGGPILTLKGEDIDLFFYPRSGFAGQILQVDDVLSFAGHVGPPLDSKLTITVTSPSEKDYTIAGQANKVGYFYQPESDLIVDEAGVWQVHVQVLHDGLTSSGPTTEPYPTGSVLGAEGGRYEIFVVEGVLPDVEVVTPEPGFMSISGKSIQPIAFRGRLPDDFQNASYTYTIAMPGFILEQGEGVVNGTNFELTYDPVQLHEEYPNLDLTAYDYPRPGLADQIWISVLLEAEGRTLPLTFTLHGEEVFHR
ncbi:MAG: hypothetical protein GTO14_12665 [Anaerolineales bacterium]|nr:hypothetical protein [Anaerolineales bacterium]